MFKKNQAEQSKRKLPEHQQIKSPRSDCAIFLYIYTDTHPNKLFFSKNQTTQEKVKKNTVFVACVCEKRKCFSFICFVFFCVCSQKYVGSIRRGRDRGRSFFLFFWVVMGVDVPKKIDKKEGACVCVCVGVGVQ